MQPRGAGEREKEEEEKDTTQECCRHARVTKGKFKDTKGESCLKNGEKIYEETVEEGYQPLTNKSISSDLSSSRPKREEKKLKGKKLLMRGR